MITGLYSESCLKWNPFFWKMYRCCLAFQTSNRWRQFIARRRSKNSTKPRTAIYLWPQFSINITRQCSRNRNEQKPLRPYLVPIPLISPFMSLVSISMVSHFNKPIPAVWLHGRIVSVSVRWRVFFSPATFVGGSARLRSNLLGIFQDVAPSDWQRNCINLVQT